MYSVEVRAGALEADLEVVVEIPGRAFVKTAICTGTVAGMTMQTSLSRDGAWLDVEIVSDEVRLTLCDEPGGLVIWDGDGGLQRALNDLGCGLADHSN
jgi:hypothetical protein